MTPNWAAITEKLIVMLVGGLGTWVLKSIHDLRADAVSRKKDLDAAFHKIRHLEKELGYDDAGTNADRQRE